MFLVLLEDETFYLFWMASSSRISLSAFTEPVLVKFSSAKRFFVLFIVFGLLAGLGIIYSTFKMYKMYIKCHQKLPKGHGIDVPQGICVLYGKTSEIRSSCSDDGSGHSDLQIDDGTESKKSNKEQYVTNELKCSSYQMYHSPTSMEPSLSSSVSPNYFEFSKLLPSVSENCDNEVDFRRNKMCKAPSTTEINENLNLHLSQAPTVSSENHHTIYSIVRCPVLIKEDAFYSIFTKTVQDCNFFTHLQDSSNNNQPLSDHDFSNVDSCITADTGQFSFDSISDYCQLPGFANFTLGSHDVGRFNKSTEEPINSKFYLDSQTHVNIEHCNLCVDPISDYCQLPGIDRSDSTGNFLCSKPNL